MKNNWRENLRPASWRGIPFQVSADDAEFGRNVAVHEFVQRDKPYVEDLGRKTRRNKIEAWICANEANNFNPWPQRDSLIEAVERGGVGTLVHPFWGSMRGHVPTISVKQASTQNGGMVVLLLEFVEAGEVEFRAQTFTDTAGRVKGSSQAVYTNVVEEFAKNFSIENVAGFVLTDAVAMMKQFTGTLSSIRRYSNLAAQVAAGNLGAIGIFAEPLSMARQVVSIISSLDQPAALHTFTRPPVPAVNTAGRVRQAANTAAFTHLVQASSVARSAELSADLGANSARYSAASTALRATPALITRTEMEAQRREITTTVTDELVQLSALNIYPDTQAALTQLRTDAVQHMTAEGEHLARTFKTTCCDGNSWNGYMPTLVLAYRHYGVLSDDVINDRNEVPNPLFLEPAASVELLAEVNL
ncbi:MAG: DNA circularization N-terminal domain-containing protein [Pseudomonadota bacterium]